MKDRDGKVWPQVDEIARKLSSSSSSPSPSQMNQIERQLLSVRSISGIPLGLPNGLIRLEGESGGNLKEESACRLSPYEHKDDRSDG